jgi:hypothetical protein
MDERLIAQTLPLGFPLQGSEHMGVDPNGDELAGYGPQWGASNSAHGAELLV